LNPPVQSVCLLMADDLTGACDAAVHFAANGFRTAALLRGYADQSQAEAIALSTESRGLAPDELRPLYRELGERLAGLAGRSQVLFKKIDSTLRGNVGAEIRLAAEAFGCARAIITPAFPAMGRTVERGALRVAGADLDPIDLAGYWRAHGLGECVHVAPRAVAEALDTGARFVSVDAASDLDLDCIAAAGSGYRRRVLWAGSAGLAAALARAWGRKLQARQATKDDGVFHGTAHRQATKGDGLPHLLFCIGSDHAVTVEQVRVLCAAREMAAFDAESARPEAMQEALGAGRSVLLRVTFGQTDAERIRLLIGDWRGALALSGGATASLVCRAIEVQEIALHREIAPGIPRGAIGGGLFDGETIVTKSGAFGGPGALMQILDDLTCP
jgi:uncharacterized protein YgbK (DUF1537 family)